MLSGSTLLRHLAQFYCAIYTLKNGVVKFSKSQFKPTGLTRSLYRPFHKSWVYFDRDFNEMVYQMPKIFPNDSLENRLISVVGRGATKEFAALMTDTLPDYEMISKGQCFPLSTYEGVEERTNEIIPQTSSIVNRVICLSVTGNKGFSALMTDQLPNYHLIGDAQCFPLFLYEEETV